MSVYMQRIFHPIGQGAFYSERHDDFNVVYDCGEFRRFEPSVDSVVKQAFTPYDVIDILFISHFHDDHINRIPLLQNHCAGIRQVFLPVLHEEMRIFLSSYYRVSGQIDMQTIVEDPQRYFESSRVVEVKQTDNLESPAERTVYEHEEVPGAIDSGTQVVIRRKKWTYIPHNHDNVTKLKELKKLLKASGLSIRKMKSDLRYCMTNASDIRAVYMTLTNRINKNTMTVYSGGYQWKYHRVSLMKHHPQGCMIHIADDRVGCVYTGDIDMNTTNIQQAYRLEWDGVGTIQLPHHGDLYSYNHSVFNGGPYMCPVSFGNYNNFGHPSPQVLAKLLSIGSIPISVSELTGSVFIENILG